MDAGGRTTRVVVPCFAFDLRAAAAAEEELWIALWRYDRMRQRQRTQVAWRATWARLWNALGLALRLGVLCSGSSADLFVRGCLEDCRSKIGVSIAARDDR